MVRQRFEIATEPHVAEIGDKEFKFVPELSSGELLEPYAKLQEFQKTVSTKNPDDLPIDRVVEGVNSIKELLCVLLVPEDRERWTALSIPDRAVMAVFQWIMEVYGGRPTGPSSVSSESVSPNGAVSTGSSSPEPIRSPGVPVASSTP